ncbi:hypothetical protein ACFX1X_022833 [Malus domestica]
MNIVAVFFLLLLTLSICSSMADYRVTVFNDLARNTNLNVHCQAAGIDPSTHSIPFLNDFSWTVNINTTAVLSCDMSWGIVKGHFDIFNAKRDATRCARNWCAWRVKQDGLYLFIELHKRLELQFTWPH